MTAITLDPAITGVFTDFDGSLSTIVDDPDAARPLNGAAEVLEGLARRFRVVGVVSGRGLEDLGQRFRPTGVLLAGAYGRERSDRPMRRHTQGWEPVTLGAASVAERLEGVVLERKGAGVALHFRNAPEHAAEVLEAARELAEAFDLELRPGRAVVELTAPGPGKGEAIAGLVRDFGLRVAFYAGDDVADLEAFEAMRDLDDLTSICVAVASTEAPPDLTERADLVLDGPEDYLALLREIEARSGD